jgi:predicted nucleic acid-binding protein
MKAVFLDTVGVLALLELSDQWHATATRALASPAMAGRPFVTTAPVLMECGNAAARKPYRRRVAEIRREFQEDGTLIVPTDADLETAWFAFERGEAGLAGIVDHISFVVMRRLGISKAFTNDTHFRAAGFETLF